MRAGLKRARAAAVKPTAPQASMLGRIAKTTHGAILYAELDTSDKRLATRMTEAGLLSMIGCTLYITKIGRDALARYDE